MRIESIICNFCKVEVPKVRKNDLFGIEQEYYQLGKLNFGFPFENIDCSVLGVDLCEKCAGKINFEMQKLKLHLQANDKSEGLCMEIIKEITAKYLAIQDSYDAGKNYKWDKVFYDLQRLEGELRCEKRRIRSKEAFFLATLLEREIQQEIKRIKVIMNCVVWERAGKE